MKNKLPQILEPLFNEKCCCALLSIGDTLILGFGEKTEYIVKGINLSKSVWECHSYSSAWRIIDETGLICGGFDTEEIISKTLSSLIDKRLLKLVETSDYDISLYFEGNVRVDFIAESSNEESISICGINDLSINFKPNVGWSIDNDTQVTSFTEKEELLSIHSERCFERWSSNLPINIFSDTCENCAYYRPLRGEFYFWDYGICSNEHSSYDGKLIGVKSGCEQFNNLLL